MRYVPIALLLAALVLSAAAPAPSTVRYRLALLERGPEWTPVKNALSDSIQAGHMANIRDMARRGVLLAAGPFENGGTLRGVFVFRPGANDGLDTLLAHDTAISMRRLACRMVTWSAPPGMGEEYRQHAAERTSRGQAPDSMLTLAWVMLRRGAGDGAAAKGLAQHEAHLAKLRREGRLIFGGPVEGGGDLLGVYVMATDSAGAVNTLARSPAVRSGALRAQVLTWWTAWGNVPGH